MRVNEVIRGRSFGERLSIVEMPREGQLLCWSLHINSAVDLSSLKLHCFQISLKVTVRISSEELVTPPVLKAFITQSFHGKLFPWPRIDENLGIFFKPSKRFDFETIVDPILEPSGKKTRQIFQDFEVTIDPLVTRYRHRESERINECLRKKKRDKIVRNAW